MKKKRTIRGYFMTGLVLVVPLFVTGYIIKLIVTFLSSLTSAIPEFLRPENYLPYHFPGIEIAITIVGIFLIGVLATNILGNKLVSIGEAILDRIPILRIIYKGTKQFLETFFSGDKEGFSSVVMVEYPRRGIYCLAFVTGRTKGEVQARTEENTINLFLPTTPNPTSGFYLVIPEKDTIPLSMSVEDAFKVIMTGGMVVPSEDIRKRNKEKKKSKDVLGPSAWRLY